MPVLNNGHLEPAITVSLGPNDIYARFAKKINKHSMVKFRINPDPKADWIVGSNYYWGLAPFSLTALLAFSASCFARSASCASFCEPERRPARAAQVFRCTPRAKGWGVRCKRRIPAGGFVSEYAGELLNEAQAHARGVGVVREAAVLVVDEGPRKRGARRPLRHDPRATHSSSFIFISSCSSREHGCASSIAVCCERRGIDAVTSKK